MKFDILIHGGEVMDPGGGLEGRFDVGIRRDKIVAVAPDLPRAEARKTIDAKGKIVTPGLVDVHAHIFEESWNMGEHTDRFCQAGGVTTVCDAGSAGSANFAGLRHFVEHHLRIRARAFVNLSAVGIVATKRGGELSHEAYADPKGCAATVIDNPGFAIGVKLRFSHGIVWEHGVAPLRCARQAADLADAPLMIHVTDSPVPLPRLLEFMRPGDIVSHCYHGYPNGIMGPQRTALLEEVVAAQRHGIVFDTAHGRGGHFNFALTRSAVEQGFLPDTISTDLTYVSATAGPVFDLPTTMTKLLHLGVPLRELVPRVTKTPAAILGLADVVGTLKPGAQADVALLALEEGDFPLHDTDGGVVTAKRRIVAALALKDGRLWHERKPSGSA